MQIEMWSIDKLAVYAKNPRQNDHAVDQVAAAIKEYGFRVPVVAKSDGTVVDGHLRLKAARALGLSEIPVVLADDLTDAQVKAFRISVNRMAELADWDFDLLRSEIEALQSLDYDLALTGLQDELLEDLLNAVEPNDGLTDEDAVPEPPTDPVSRPGDVWVLGNHRLVCGDSTSRDAYTLLLGGGEHVSMVWTDPPYNVDYRGQAGKIKNDKMKITAFYKFLRSAFGCMFENLINGGAIYVAHADASDLGLTFRQAYLDAGFKLSSCLIWRKNRLIISRADYHPQHESILYGWKPTGAHRWFGDRKKTTIQELFGEEMIAKVDDDTYQLRIGEVSYLITGENIRITEAETSVILAESPVKSDLHPTMKPVALIEKMLFNSSKSGELVLDPFGGSGSTLIACEKIGRRARLVELDEKFCDVIVKRWQDFTGCEAILETDGGTYNSLVEYGRCRGHV